VAGRTPEEAIANFVGSLNETLSCVADRRLAAHQESEHQFKIFYTSPVLLKDRTGARFYLSIAQIFTVQQRTDGMFKVHTRYYNYVFADGPEPSHHGVVSYHWHPSDFALRDPHLHLRITQQVGYPEIERKIGKAHYPTSRICLEDFVLMLIKYYDIPPRIGGGRWSSILRRNKKAFSKEASWFVAHNE
jgi:hypothetical protein